MKMIQAQVKVSSCLKFVTRLLLSILFLISISTGDIAAEGSPMLSVSPTSGPPGSTVRLTGSGYTGGLEGAILWDSLDVDILDIPSSGMFTVDFSIPPGASLGMHTITVCTGNPCFTGEFEERASATFEVTPGEPSAGTFDVQIQAIEVTQGIRGDIPSRTPPRGSIILPLDRAVHVANRRTIVRAYPWVQAAPGTTVPPLTAQLFAFRDGRLLPGSPISPVNPRLEGVSPDDTLEEMRSDATKSWNFVLPPGWVSLSEDEESFSILFVAEANPLNLEPECEGCDDNNLVLLGQDFMHVRREPYFPLPTSRRPTRSPLVIVPYFITQICTDATGGRRMIPDPTLPPSSPQSTMIQFLISLSEMRKLLPIAEGSAGMVVMPPIPETWETGRCDRSPTSEDSRDFDVTMIRRHFPGGAREGDPLGVYRMFIFNDNNTWINGGYGFCGTSHLVADTGKFTILHELTHCIGLDHAGTGHCERLNSSCIGGYPDDHGQIEPNAFGFDTFLMSAISPQLQRRPEGLEGDPCQPLEMERPHDYMSGGPGLNKWTSLYTWETIASLLGQPDVDAAGSSMRTAFTSAIPKGEHLLISGSIDSNEIIRLQPLFFSAPALSESPPNDDRLGEYWIEFRDIQGVLLDTHKLTLIQASDLKQPIGLFSESVLPPTDWRTLAIVKNQTALATFSRSASAPEVSLITPTDGTQWPATGEVTVSWEARDADKEALTFRVEGSPDGQAWVTLASDITGTSVTVDLAAIPSGGWQKGQIRVQASDGLNVTVSKPRLVNLAPKPPQPYILNPLMGDRFVKGQKVTLLGVAGDWQDGQIESGNLEWLLNGKVIGKGERMELSLPPGTYSLVLRATNSMGLTRKMEVQLVVNQK